MTKFCTKYNCFITINDKQGLKKIKLRFKVMLLCKVIIIIVIILQFSEENEHAVLANIASTIMSIILMVKDCKTATVKTC